MWELDHKKGWAPKNWCFGTVVLEKTVDSALDSKDIKPVNPKGNQPWIFIGRTDAEAETPNTLATWYEELTHWKRPWSWEGSNAKRDRGGKGWDGWKAITVSKDVSLHKFVSIESVILSNHLILCHPLLLLPSNFPSIRVFSNESTLPIRWPKYWSFILIINLSNEYSELISFRIDWFDSLAVQGTLKCLLQWVGSSHQVAKVLELKLQHQSFQWIFRVDFL